MRGSIPVASQTRDEGILTAKTAVDSRAAAVSKTSFARFGVLLIKLIGAAIGGWPAVQRRHRVTGRTIG
ncbi:hypothetical protein [Lichenicoccus sp.]|uniref:hypothetical protein n=1 Tax=Lichenicoccus sp. TaxID=2781899 RepID=UPI003D0AE60D